MLRSRSLTYIIGSLLALLTVYTFHAWSQPRNVHNVVPQAPDPARADEPFVTHAPAPQQPVHDKTGEKTQSPTEHDKSKPKSKPKPPPKTETQHLKEFKQDPATLPAKPKRPSAHSIEELIEDADYTFRETLSHQTYNLNDAAAAYRKRRGRHPPPGFDLWHEYATANNAIMVEEYWDQIYHDLNPFWAITPKMLRAQARAENMAVEVKDGRAKANNDWFWHEIWGRMINETSDYLPDMYLAMNPMDESRLLVQWETIDEYMKIVEAEKTMPPPEEVSDKVQGWGAEKEEDAPEHPDPRYNGFNVYKYARSACPPNSSARQVGGILSTEKIYGTYKKSEQMADMSQYFDGAFVSNYTETSDYCNDASIGGLHGALMQPLSCSVSDVLLPMFGGSKFHANNEILLPAPMYWNEEIRFGGGGAGDQVAWADKTPTVIWRGTATGGRSKPYTWHLFHRHRFVAMANATKYRLASTDSDPIFSPFLREAAIKQLHKGTQENLSDWLATIHDVSFTNLVCDEVEPDGGCWYINDEYDINEPIEFVDQFVHKYTPDIDGNSFSGRYRAFLLSNSLPVKATIYREWHDSRLVAWKHFVPMNNRFSDYYAIMEYFLGSEAAGIAGHDDQARKIATDGRDWAERVLRKVDMQIYVGRLLLEYARLTDDNRQILGWVKDLLANPGS